MDNNEFQNLTISIGHKNTIKEFKKRFLDEKQHNYNSTASTYKLPYENKDEYIIHINEKVLEGSQEWQAAIAAHEAYHYCLANFSQDDEEYFAYKIENLVSKIVHEMILEKNIC